VAKRLAERLGDAVQLGQIVHEIEQSAEGVRVRTADREYSARAVIVCLPPQLDGTLRYDPPLPADLQRAFAAHQTGNTSKLQAIYERPFWRDRGWSGTGILWEGPQTFTYDNTPREGGPGVLLGFLTARRATDWNRRSLNERKTAALQAWATVFGPEALSPLDYVEMDWTMETFTRGGYGCHFPPGAWCELGPAVGGERMPRFDRVWWAASDLAKDWNGYLEGALFAGEQAAWEVADVLK
jgi:monoamine oxidase